MLSKVDVLCGISPVQMRHNGNLICDNVFFCRLHAEFQLNKPPQFAFWFTPGQFFGRVIMKQDGSHVEYVHVYVPTNRSLNVGEYQAARLVVLYMYTVRVEQTASSVVLYMYTVRVEQTASSVVLYMYTVRVEQTASSVVLYMYTVRVEQTASSVVLYMYTIRVEHTASSVVLYMYTVRVEQTASSVVLYMYTVRVEQTASSVVLYMYTVRVEQTASSFEGRSRVVFSFCLFFQNIVVCKGSLFPALA